IYLVMFPDLAPGTWTTSDYPFRGIHEKVAATAAGAGFRVIDLVPTFVAAGLDWRAWWATPYDSHPNAAAHRMAAETIARELLAAGVRGRLAAAGGPVGGAREGAGRHGRQCAPERFAPRRGSEASTTACPPPASVLRLPSL